MSTRKDRISQMLTQSLAPLYLDLVDESSGHQVPAGAESHFKLTLVSEAFIGLSRIQRQQCIHTLIETERHQGLHALSLALFSPEEWQKHPTIQVSPLCHRQKKSE